MSNINKKRRDKNGKRHGEWVYYHDNGQLMSRSNWIHGTRHGFCEGYDYDGRLEYRGHFNIDKKIGYWIWDIKKHYYLCLI